MVIKNPEPQSVVPSLVTVVGLHIPKCAGTSLLTLLERVFGPEACYQTTSFVRNFRERRPEFFEIPDRRRLRVVWGHYVHEQMLHYLNAPLLVTGLREPRQRLESDVRFQICLHDHIGRAPFDPESWIQKIDNPICRFIIERFPALSLPESGPDSLFERAKAALECFDSVLFMDTLEQDVAKLCQRLGITSVTVPRSNEGELLDLDIDLSSAKTDEDDALYDWAREAFVHRRHCRNSNRVKLEKFLQMESDQGALERFLNRYQCAEYKQWGVLEQVLAEKRKKISRLNRQVSYFSEQNSAFKFQK